MLGITLYPGGISYADVAEIARHAEDGGFDGIYFVERIGHNDALAAAQVAATATTALTVGTNIVNGYMRIPSHLAAQAMAVDEISDGRLVLGIGASHSGRVKALGLTWRPAVEYLSDTTRVLRAAFAGAARDGSSLGRNARHPIPIHWAAVATESIVAAGAEADGLMKFLAPLPRIAEARRIFEDAVRDAGASPGSKPVSLLTPVFLSDDRAAAYDAARSYLAFYAAMPLYKKIFAASGFDAEVAAIRAEDPTDLGAIAGHLSEAMLDAILVVGSASRCRERLAEFAEAGIDDPLLSPQAVGGSVRDAATALVSAFGRS